MKAFPYHGATREEIQSVLGPYLRKFGCADGRLALVIDADRTLAPEDTGRLVGAAFGINEEIRCIFETLGYCEQAFIDVSKVWGKLPSGAYLLAISKAAEGLHLRGVWSEILLRAGARTPTIVVSSGIPQAWRAALDLHSFAEVPVLGGCHPQVDQFLVFPRTKRELVIMLQAAGWRVLAAGDSPIDLDMLEQADLPVFVPDARGSPRLRALLPSIPGIRHLLVDEQHFPGLPTLAPSELIAMLEQREFRA